MNDFVIGAIAAFVPAFLSAVLILVLEKCVSSRVAKNERTIARHNKEMDRLRVAKGWAYRSFTMLSEDMAIAKALSRGKFFMGGEGVNINLQLPMPIQEVNLSDIDTVSVDLKNASLALEHKVKLFNYTIEGFRGLYDRVVDLCYLSDWALLKNVEFRDNTNRDFRIIEKEIHVRADELRRELIQFACMIDVYFGGIAKMGIRKAHWWNNFGKIIEKKNSIRINTNEVISKTNDFMSRIGFE